MGTLAITVHRPAAAALRRAAGAIERRPVLARWLLAGPGALLAAVLVMAAMPVWLPAGAAGVDNLVYPIVLAPLIWTVVFVYALLENSLPRATAVLTGLFLVDGILVALTATGTIHVNAG
ncbi:MAG: hypothetical protein RLO51_25810 [Thalassobaculum sp.]|uniref:hypothetical protein n=1 Tax=Thalassobaculum sp. TaxID=2022740 RepID=UPI0032F057D0